MRRACDWGQAERPPVEHSAVCALTRFPWALQHLPHRAAALTRRGREQVQNGEAFCFDRLAHSLNDRLCRIAQPFQHGAAWDKSQNGEAFCFNRG